MTTLIDYWHSEYNGLVEPGYILWMKSTPTLTGEVIVAPAKIYEGELRDCPDGPIPTDNYYAEPSLSDRRYSAIKQYPNGDFELIVGSVVYGVPGFKAGYPDSPNPQYDGFVDTGWESGAINEPFDKFLANQFRVLYRRNIHSQVEWMKGVEDWFGSVQELEARDLL